jgi:2-aminoadipate transaminase
MDWQDAFAARARVDVGGGIAAIMALVGAPGIISFAGGLPDPSTFPGPVLSDLLAELVDEGDESAFQYGSTWGLPGPRAYVADRIETLQGRRPGDGELMITSGAIEALELVAKTFLDPGDLVVVEAPTYLGAIMSFRSYQATVTTVPLDDDGMRVDALEDLLRSGARPKLVYTIPDHQNPAGVSMTADRRRALVELVVRYGTLVVEDVAYRELSFHSEQDPPSLWSLAPDAVVQAGTFSKTFFPGVRLGWAAGPRAILDQLVIAKQTSDQCASSLAQRLLERYGRAGHLDERNAYARKLYAVRAAALMAACARELPAEVAWTEPRGGFFSWLTLPAGHDTTALAPRAVAAGFAFVPGSPFFPDARGSRHLRLCFSRTPTTDIDEGIHRLGTLLRETGIS